MWRQPLPFCVPPDSLVQAFQELKIGHPCTPVNVSALSPALSSHPNSCFVNYLITGLFQGFLAGLRFPPRVYVCGNLLSARAEPEIVEVCKGYMIEPFSRAQFPRFSCQPLRGGHSEIFRKEAP